MFTTVEKSEGTKEFLISGSPHSTQSIITWRCLTWRLIVLCWYQMFLSGWLVEMKERQWWWEQWSCLILVMVIPSAHPTVQYWAAPQLISLPSGYLIKKGLCLISVDWAHSNICTSDNWRAGHSGASHGAWHTVITLLAFNFPSLSKAKLHLSLAASAAVKGNQSSAEWEQCSGTVTMVGRYISHISYTPTPTPTVQWPSNVTYISWSVIFQWKYSNNQK